MTTVWYPKQGTVYISGDAISTVNSTDDLETQFLAGASEVDVTAYCTNVQFSNITRDVSAINPWGPSQLLKEEKPDMPQVTFTLIFQNPAAFDMLRSVTAPTGRERWQGGEAATSDRTSCAVFLKLSDGTNDAQVLMNNARCTDISHGAGGEDYYEITLTYKCLHQDFYWSKNS